MPEVSVIIPVYNGEAFLREALESVFAQDFDDYELIVADDGSTDGSRAIAASFPRVRVLALDHRGVSHARNAAIRTASAEWIAFLDADDRWLPRKLSAQLAAAAENPRESVILSHSRYEVVQPPPAWYRGPPHGTEQPAFEPSTWMVRREVFASVGFFDEARVLAEDVDWLVRVRDAGIRPYVVAECLTVRCIHGGNASGTIPGSKEAIVRALRDSVVRKRMAGPGAAP